MVYLIIDLTGQHSTSCFNSKKSLSLRINKKSKNKENVGTSAIVSYRFKKIFRSKL